MPEFSCKVCGKHFSVPEAALEKYPNWKPKYCKTHSPRAKEKKKATDTSSEERLSAETILERYHEGPLSGLFTDGGARPNPGPGGWGLVHVKDNQIITEKWGHDPDTTNNRMELTALIEAFKLLEPGSKECIYSDSDLCVKTINVWASSWEKRGWKRKTGEIKNLDLVKELYALHLEHPGVELKWVKAHAGWRWNEYVDYLAGKWTE